MRKKILNRISALAVCTSMILPAIGSKGLDTSASSYTGILIHDNITINGIDVSGLSYVEAMSLVKSSAGNETNATVTINSSVGNVSTSLGDLGYSLDYVSAVKEAMSVGNSGSLLKRYKDNINLRTNGGMDIELSGSIDSQAVYNVIQEKIGDALNGSTSGVELKKEENGKVRLVTESSGISVNYEETYQRIVDAMGDDWNGGAITVDLSTEEGGMSERDKQLAEVTDLLGEYTTDYSSAAGRMKNVERATSLLNGRILYPGEQLNTHKSIEPISASNGYHLAGQYVGGRLVDGVGGGVCQVSTTLYNAVLRAELEIVQRNNHGMSVSYVPLSADAALAGNTYDLRFKNNTDAPIYIEGSTSGGKVTFRIYGKETRPSNRKIEFVSKTIETIEPPADVITVDDSLPKGKKKVEQKAHVGYKAELWKNVYIDGQLTDSIRINKSTYKATPKYISVGPGTDINGETTTEATTQETTEKTTEKTEEKTEKKTEEKTEKKTEEKTEKPTEEKTEKPTEEKTEKPTEEKTEAPTEAPAPEAEGGE